jgi:hypothetical protein
MIFRILNLKIACICHFYNFHCDLLAVYLPTAQSLTLQDTWKNNVKPKIYHHAKR